MDKRCATVLSTMAALVGLWPMDHGLAAADSLPTYKVPLPPAPVARSACPSESEALDLVLRSTELMAPVTVEVRRAYPITWTTAPSRPSDPAGFFLKNEREGRFLKVLEEAGLVSLRIVETRWRWRGRRRPRAIEVSLTPKGEGLAIRTGLAPGTAAATPWAFPAISKGAVWVRGNCLADVTWEWQLTDLGAALHKAKLLEPPPSGAARTMVRFARVDDVWKLEGRAFECQEPTHAMARCSAGDAGGCFDAAQLVRLCDAARAAALLEKSCDLWEPRACVELGDLYRSKNEVARRVHFYQMACDLPTLGYVSFNSEGCAKLGRMYDDGDGVSQDKAKAVRLLKRACTDDDREDRGDACYRLAVLYAGGVSRPQDFADAAQLFSGVCARHGAWRPDACVRACDSGSASACVNLGVLYATGEASQRDFPRDTVKARQLYQKACDGGSAIGCQLMRADELQAGCTRGGAPSCRDVGTLCAKGYWVAPGKERKCREADSAASEATEFFRAACDAGDATGCAELGVRLGYGTGVAQDRAQAVKLLETACEQGAARGCAGLAALYEQGAAAPKDMTETMVRLYQRACDAGEMQACVALASRYASGAGVTTDEAHAAQLYRRACEGRNAEACESLGRLGEAAALHAEACERGNASARQDWIAAGDTRHACANARFQKRRMRRMQQLREGCDRGQAEDCRELGILSWGAGQSQADAVRAAELFRKACGRRDMLACAFLAERHLVGVGVPRNVALAARLARKACQTGLVIGCGILRSAQDRLGWRAKHWPMSLPEAPAPLEKACQQGRVGACYLLGELLDVGTGIAQDKRRAVKFYQRACDLGEAMGCATLSQKYEDGEGVTTDSARAVQLSQKGCDGGEPTACTRLAGFYLGDSAVPHDRARAAKLHEKACQGGDASGCTNLASVHSQGSREERKMAEAARFAREACRMGSPEGCSQLASILEADDSEVRGRAAAIPLHQKACDSGAMGSCLNLAGRYFTGNGVTRDPEKAVRLYRRACDGGDSEACDELDRLDE